MMRRVEVGSSTTPVSVEQIVMRRRILPLMCFALAAGVLPVCAQEPFHFPEGTQGAGELKYVNGVPLLVLEGTHEEIGKQMALLAVKPASRLLDYPNDLLQAAYGGNDLIDKLRYKTLSGFLTQSAHRMAKAFPEDYKTELDCMIEAGGFDRTKALVGNTMFDAKAKLLDLRKGFGCSTLFLEGKRTSDGKPLCGRNLDFQTAGYLQEYSLVTVYRQKGKHAFASVGFPGLVGCLSGMNDAGLTVAVLEVYETKEDGPALVESGVPYAMCVRRLLEDCSTIDEAERALRDMKRTTILNLAVGDMTQAVVFEITPKSIAVRKSQDGVCICTNHFRTEELCTATRCSRYELLSDCEDRVDLAALARHLDSVNQGSHTLQTMIFEPETLTMYLAIGACPSSALPLQTLELGELFKQPGTRTAAELEPPPSTRRGSMSVLWIAALASAIVVVVGTLAVRRRRRSLTVAGK